MTVSMTEWSGWDGEVLGSCVVWLASGVSGWGRWG